MEKKKLLVKLRRSGSLANIGLRAREGQSGEEFQERFMSFIKDMDRQASKVNDDGIGETRLSANISQTHPV